MGGFGELFEDRGVEQAVLRVCRSRSPFLFKICGVLEDHYANRPFVCPMLLGFIGSEDYLLSECAIRALFRVVGRRDKMEEVLLHVESSGFWRVEPTASARMSWRLRSSQQSMLGGVWGWWLGWLGVTGGW